MDKVSAYPDDWDEQPLEAVADISPESLGAGTPPSFRFKYIDISSVEVGVIDWNSVTNQVFETSPSRARRVVRPNDVLLSTVRPALQSHTFANWFEEEGYVCSTGFSVIRAREGLKPRFLKHLIFGRTIASQLRKYETGSNYPAVPESDVRRLLVPLPPLLEQRRIAEILDAADEAIRQTERVIAKLREVKRGLLHDLLTRGLDADGNLRDPVAHPEQFKDSPLGSIPREWEVSPVEAFADVVRGSSPRPKGDPRYYGGSIPRVMVEDIMRDGKWVTPQVDSLTVLGAKSSRPLTRGDLVVVCSGTVGVPSLLAVDACIHDGILGLRNLNQLRVDREFLYYHFVIMKQTLDSQATHGGVFTNLTTSIMKNTLVPLPSLNEQTRIAAILDAHDARIRAEEAVLAKRRQVKRGLMTDLLTGRVRVLDH